MLPHGGTYMPFSNSYIPSYSIYPYRAVIFLSLLHFPFFHWHTITGTAYILMLNVEYAYSSTLVIRRDAVRRSGSANLISVSV